MRLPISIPLILRNVKISGPRGSVMVDMIVDSGAACTAMCWADAKLLGYDPAVAQQREEIITANGVIEVPRLTVKSIKVGDITATDVAVIVHDIPELAGVRGLLGLTFLQSFRTVIDYREGYLEIS